MSNSEKFNNEELSFEDLLKDLGVDATKKVEVKTQKKKITELKATLNDDNVKVEQKLTQSETISTKVEFNPTSSDDLFAEIEQKIIENTDGNNTSESKHIVENGKTFVDITEQYVKRDTSQAEETPRVVTRKKKKVRTFNEIFSDFFKNFIPVKKDSTKEKIRKIIMDVSIITIVCCCVAFGNLYVERQLYLKQTEEIKGMVVDTDGWDDNQYVEAWQEVFAKYPTIQFPENMNLKYSYLYAVNQDLVGWVKIANTNLDVQVVQSNDNDYYLNRDFYGKTSRYGCPYLDFKNDPQYLDDNTVIYGHHMTDGLVFSNLDKYKTLEGYKESPIIEYSTLYETYHFKVFAAFVSNAHLDDDNGQFFNFIATDFSTDEKFSGFIKEVEKRSIFKTGVNVQPDDKIITLVTCSYEFDSARLVIMGRLLRENEEPVVDVDAATLNTSPKYPQAWYDAKNMTNPYADDICWTP